MTRCVTRSTHRTLFKLLIMLPCNLQKLTFLRHSRNQVPSPLEQGTRPCLIKPSLCRRSLLGGREKARAPSRALSIAPCSSPSQQCQVQSRAGVLPALRHCAKTIRLLLAACQRHTRSPLEKAASSSSGRLRGRWRVH